MAFRKLIEMIRYFFTRRLRKETEEYLQDSVTRYNSFLASLSGHYVSYKELASITKEWEPVYQRLKNTWIPKSHNLYDGAYRIITDVPLLPNMVEATNKAFVDGEISRYNDLLSDIDGKSLDFQQRIAVVTGEESNLVLAGAGSGKTLTIAGKVKYLCQTQGVDPEDILLIAFTRKAAEEMNERINGRLGISVKTATFHKLGLDIISGARNERPDVSDSLADFVRTYLNDTIRKIPEEIKPLIQFFAYYLKIPADLEKFDTLGEAYDYERGADLETLQSKFRQSEYIAETTNLRRREQQTLRKETVKSLEEVEIANFLFLSGINYEYEAKYPFDVNDIEHKSYRPDFYLPDYDLYIEHFGIAKDGSVPWLSKVEEQKYLESMRWKRKIHEQCNTCLLETYSFYSSEGRLLKELENMLRERGVEFKEPDFNTIFNTIYEEAGEKYFSEFVTLCSTFITLYKSRGGSVEELDDLEDSGTEKQNYFYRERTRFFLKIIKPILTAYNKYLAGVNAIDFSDMINKATDLVTSGFQVHPYKWIIIDEYQDISVSRFKLIKAIIEQTGAKLLCVGDDWQSIYRFAGSDIALFTRFADFFPNPAILRIEQTYRNSQQLIDAAGSFIMKNPSQYKKSLRSAKRTEIPLQFVCYLDDPVQGIQYAMDEIIKEYGRTSSVLFLGRTRYDVEVLKQTSLFQLQKSGKVIYKSSPETPITFLTVHKAKGLEADNVLLLNFRNDNFGFPNKIADDPLLGLVLTDLDEYPYAEERRLFYVAMTRTRNKAYILVDDVIPSEFFQEFMDAEEAGIVHHDPRYQEEKVACPRCRTGHLVVRKNNSMHKDFLGCSNYPRCEYTVNDTSVLRQRRKCPMCGGFLVKRHGHNTFYGCSNYPFCRYTQNKI